MQNHYTKKNFLTRQPITLNNASNKFKARYKNSNLYRLLSDIFEEDIKTIYCRPIHCFVLFTENKLGYEGSHPFTKTFSLKISEKDVNVNSLEEFNSLGEQVSYVTSLSSTLFSCCEYGPPGVYKFKKFLWRSDSEILEDYILHLFKEEPLIKETLRTFTKTLVEKILANNSQRGFSLQRLLGLKSPIFDIDNVVTFELLIDLHNLEALIYY